MSFAHGSTTGSPLARRTARRGLWRGENDEGDEVQPRPAGSSSVRELGRVGLVGAGIAVGILIGASVALLLAPDSGARTRLRVRRRLRRTGRRARDRWDDLSDALRYVRS